MKKRILWGVPALLITVSALAATISNTPLLTSPLQSTDRVPAGRTGVNSATTISVDQMRNYTQTQMSTAGYTTKGYVDPRFTRISTAVSNFSAGAGFISTGAAFGGDVTGTYNNLTVTDNSHSHTSSTLPTNTLTATGLVLSGSGNASKVWKTDSSGNPAWRDDATGGTPTFDTVGAGTNSTAAMVIDTGASLNYSNSGTINASGYKGNSTPTGTEFGYVAGLTSAAQTQINTKLPTTTFTTYTTAHRNAADPHTGYYNQARGDARYTQDSVFRNYTGQHKTNNVNPMAAPFKCNGDGTNYDTTCLQAAIDAVYAKGSGTVELPDGKYKVTSVTVKPGVTLKGTATYTQAYDVNNNRGSTILCTSAATTYTASASISATSATLTVSGFSLTSDDVGKDVRIAGAGSGGDEFWASIASVTNSTTAGLSMRALTTVSGADITIGLPCVGVQQGGNVEHVAFYYPDQTTSGAMTLYMPTVSFGYPSAGHGVTKSRITDNIFINSYYAIGGHNYADSNYIERNWIGDSYLGINLMASGNDTFVRDNVIVKLPTYGADASRSTWITANGIGYQFGSLDDVHINDNLAFQRNIGMKFVVSNKSAFGGSSLSQGIMTFAKGNSIDLCNTGILISNDSQNITFDGLYLNAGSASTPLIKIQSTPIAGTYATSSTVKFQNVEANGYFDVGLIDCDAKARLYLDHVNTSVNYGTNFTVGDINNVDVLQISNSSFLPQTTITNSNGLNIGSGVGIFSLSNTVFNSIAQSAALTIANGVDSVSVVGNTFSNCATPITDNSTTSAKMISRNVGITETFGGGSGDVTGPASSTDNAICRFDGTTGKVIQNSLVTITDSGTIIGVGALMSRDSANSPVLDFRQDNGDGTFSKRVGFISDHANNWFSERFISNNYLASMEFLRVTRIGEYGVEYVLLPNGNIGIGDDTPAEKLSVAGNIKITGSITDGSYGFLPSQVTPNLTTIAPGGSMTCANRTIILSTGATTDTSLPQANGTGCINGLSITIKNLSGNDQNIWAGSGLPLDGVNSYKRSIPNGEAATFTIKNSSAYAWETTGNFNPVTTSTTLWTKSGTTVYNNTEQILVGTNSAGSNTQKFITTNSAGEGALIQRTTTSGTNAVALIADLDYTTTQTMADGFGPLFRFTANGNALGQIGAVRAGADNTGDVVIRPTTAGSGNERVRVPSDGGMRLVTATRPTCDAAHRGTFFYVAGAAGVKDTVEVCGKAADDNYAWRTIY